MAIIVSSSIVEDRAQTDGRRYVRERHLEADGKQHEFVWLAAPGQNASAALGPRAAWLQTHLPASELETKAAEVEAGQRAIALRYVTARQFADFLRARFATATGLVAARIAIFFLLRSDAELMAVFAVTTEGLAALRSRLRARKDAYEATMALVGE